MTRSCGQIARGHAVTERVTRGQGLRRSRRLVSFVPFLDDPLLSVASSPEKIVVRLSSMTKMSLATYT